MFLPKSLGISTLNTAFVTGQGYIFHQFFSNGLLVMKEGNAWLLIFDYYLVDLSMLGFQFVFPLLL